MGEDKAWLVSPDIVGLIHRACPVLQDLFIAVQRSASNAQEVAIYRALGRLPSIKRLQLTFHLTNVRLPLIRNYTPGQAGPTDTDIRDAMINHAVDSTLAKAIFTTISAAKTSGPPLEQLELRAEEWSIASYRQYPYTLLKVLGCLRRSWICERAVRDDCVPHECLARESHSKEIRAREYKESRRHFDRELKKEDEMIFRSVWPGTGPWKNAWYSLPLDTSS